MNEVTLGVDKGCQMKLGVKSKGSSVPMVISLMLRTTFGSGGSLGIP